MKGASARNARFAEGVSAIGNTASIGGLVGLPRVAAIDTADEGIRVNAVCPGYVETPMTVESLARRGDQILARVPAARHGRPEEIANAVVIPCSDRAAFVTGAAWTVDGGCTAT